MFSIHSTSAERSLDFSDVQDGSFLVELRDRQFSASRRVESWNPGLSVREYFSNLSAQRLPWEGELCWGAVDGFFISATCSRLGHVSLNVTLSSSVEGAGWEVSGVIACDLGQLPSIGFAAAALFAAKGGS